MDRLFGPCDLECCYKLGNIHALHEQCAYFNIDTGEFCSCSCHTVEDVSLRLDKIFGYAPGQGIKRKVGK